MGIAKQQIGVTRGYKAKTKRSPERAPNASLKILASLRASAREIRAFVAAELVYATMDTARLLNYLTWQFGFRARRRVDPVRHDLELFVHEHELLHDSPTLATEKIRV